MKNSRNLHFIMIALFICLLVLTYFSYQYLEMMYR